MRRFRVFGMALMALFAVGVMTASAAFAESTPLPLIHTALKGEVYPINLIGLVEQTEEGDIQLANADSTLEAKALHILLEAKELTALGQGTIVFLGVHEKGVGGEKCNSTGGAVGEVTIPDVEWHLVYTALSPKEILESAVLTLFSKLTFKCGALETTVTAPNLGRLLDKPESGLENDSVDMEIHTHCSNIANGIQELSSYFNDKLELLTGQLLKANISGTGSVNSCQEIKPTLLLEIEKGTAGGNSALMFTVLL
jgi:hypothetical protein